MSTICVLESYTQKITAIVVTYGNRWALLKNLIHCLTSEELIAEIVIVNNASHYDVTTACSAENFPKVVIVNHDVNIGSAGGFSAGISCAVSRGADFVFLLDDDNLSLPGTLPKLLRTHNSLVLHSREPIVVVAYRKCQYDNFWNVQQKLIRYQDDFMGFNVFNALQRYFLPVRQCNVKVSGPEFFNATRRGPYSGMLLSAHSLQMIGLPHKDMIIYYDDVEWLIRILNIGGTVFLDTDACIEEQNDNYASSVFNKPIVGIVFADSESKIYYLIRNRIYLDVHIEYKKSWYYAVNKYCFLGLLLICSLVFGKLRRMNTILDACVDGTKGRLGMNLRYELT